MVHLREMERQKIIPIIALTKKRKHKKNLTAKKVRSRSIHLRVSPYSGDSFNTKPDQLLTRAGSEINGAVFVGGYNLALYTVSLYLV